jgi:hypothetical protein
MKNGNVRDYIRLNPDADRMRLVSEVASGAHKIWRLISAAYVDR